jgi:DNA-binding beta-propeller fold protein YncE
MFVDPEGRVIGRLEGEMTYEQGKGIVTEMISEFKAAGVLLPGPAPFRLEIPPTEVLNFPGKVLADAAGGRLFIADSGHHRIVVTDLDGLVLETIGTGEEGLADGATTGARFDRPQGMALAGDMLYVADTESHAIRRVDLSERIVETIAGSGLQGVGPIVPGPALAADLRSPWDVEVDDSSLYIAMAGSHQLWTLDLEAERLSVLAGSGAENIIDGPPGSAALAQPSGIVRDGATLYFADSETSSVRAVGLADGAEVRTLVGRGLFDFGDQDGEGTVARFQHALGVEMVDGVIYVADTYNNKVRRLDPATRVVSTLAGTGEVGLEDGDAAKARFFEPGGLSVAGGLLYVADTNNHAVRVVDVASGAVRTLDIRL